MARRFRYDYYTVAIPHDLGDDETKENAAITEARERAHLWCVPCEWEVKRILTGFGLDDV